jgi:hypothetical protein
MFIKKEMDTATSYSHKSDTDPNKKIKPELRESSWKNLKKKTFMADQPFLFLWHVYSMVLPDTLIAHLLSQVGDVRTYYLERIDYQMVQVRM